MQEVHVCIESQQTGASFSVAEMEGARKHFPTTSSLREVRIGLTCV